MLRRDRLTAQARRLEDRERHRQDDTFGQDGGSQHRNTVGRWRQLRPLIIAVAVLVLAPTAATAAILPPGFQETAAFTGLVNPTSVRFAADGRVFVAEKRGRVLVYDSLADPTPRVLLDVSTAVHGFWDRGLLGMALDPQFTSGRPYVYVLYTYDKDPSSPTVPRWGDGCPTPPGATADGCVVSGRLSRVGPDGTETPLITDWCQQYRATRSATSRSGPTARSTCRRATVPRSTSPTTARTATP
jgi:Glucose / Sorbosone dehydrogenase